MMKKIFWEKDVLSKYSLLGLNRVKDFMNVTGYSQDSLPSIFHIAGTNGKGSTTAYLKYILEAEGYLVHRFTSPHLVNWNERIEVSSKIITDDYANELLAECKSLLNKHKLQLSYFEVTTIMAFLAFVRNPAIATILEVGLGGRFDATNIIFKPLVEIITSISLDHQKILGNTLTEIAAEKAGIIKKNQILIINKQKKEALEKLHEIGEEKSAKIYTYGQEWSTTKLENSFIFQGFGRIIELPLPYLQGDYQIENAGGAIASLLSQNKIKVSDQSIIQGLKNVRWIGRLQNMSENKKLNLYLPKNSELIIDGSHNEDGAEELVNWLIKQEKKYNILIIGMLKRKDSRSYINKLNKVFDFIITIGVDNNEAFKTPKEFKQEFMEADCQNVISSENFINALKYIGQNFNNGDKLRVVITGSLYLIGDVLERAL